MVGNKNTLSKAWLIFFSSFDLSILSVSNMVLVPTSVKKTVYERIFNDGVIVVKKDSKLKEHRDFPGVSNLVVMMITKSLESKYAY